MKETAYLLQSALISAWWIGLASSAFIFDAFQFDEISPTAFWAFFAPDVILIAVLSAIRAYRKDTATEYVILGAFAYASLYCLNATILTASGYLPTTIMLIGLTYNAFLCFNPSLFRASSTSVTRNALKTLVQVVCIWFLALVVIPYVILDAFDALTLPSFGISLIAGALLFICSGLLGLTSTYFMVRDGAGTPLTRSVADAVSLAAFFFCRFSFLTHPGSSIRMHCAGFPTTAERAKSSRESLGSR